MRKKGLLMLLSMFSLICIFTGCKDEDSVEIVQEGEFVGVYKGALDVKLGEEEVAKNMPQKVYITQVTDAQNQIKMELKNFNFGPLSLGNIVVDKCDVIKKGNTCTFTGKQKLTLPAPIGECDVKLEGSIINDKIELDIDVAATQGGSSIEVEVDFNGSKLAADQSSDAKIESFTFESKFVTSQPVIEGKNITFLVIDTIPAAELAALVPSFTISAKATVSPASGVAQDFSKPVTYKVTSEDGIITTEYTVSVGGKVMKYSFDEWAEAGSYKVKYLAPLPFDKLASSNAGADMLVAFGFKGGFPVLKTDDAKEGPAAAKLVTLYTQGAGFNMAPVVTSGSLFAGQFKLNIVDQLSSTKFGIPFSNKPLRFKGYYKYTGGTPFYNGKVDQIIEKSDSCSISAVLYEVQSEDEFLTGHDINTSDKRVASTKLVSGDKAEYTLFDLDFDYIKAYDPAKKYKLAFICSSSKDGDAFKGAVNSTLFVDELEIVYE